MSPKKTPAGLLRLMMALLVVGVSGQQSPTPATALPRDPSELVRTVVRNELSAEANDHTHWRYRNHKESDGLAQDRDVIETRDGSLARTLLINGRPLTPDERNKDEQRMKQLVNDPNERAKREHRAKQDDEKAQELLKAIPDAFIFRYDGTDGPLTRLAFTPKSEYSPPTRELSVYHAMAGKLWVDASSLRLAMIQGRLIEEVKFGWGLLGHLDKGGTFTVIRQNVGDNHWDTVSLDVNMQGRAVIFKSLNVKERETLTDFRRMPDDLTIARAFELLQQGTASADPGSQTTAAK